jgi:hypothetical protein
MRTLQTTSMFLGAVLAAAVLSAQAPAERTFQIPPDEMPRQFDQAAGQGVLKESLALIRVPDARTTFNVSGAGLTAAILDTGLLTTHVDFRGRVAAQHNWTPDNQGAADNALDGQGHGTNVAGIIAANAAPPQPGDSKGEHTGVAPNAKLIPLKVLTNQGGGNFSWVEGALTWVLQNADQYNISVINLSLGDGQNYTADPALAGDKIPGLIQRLRAKRVAVVVAAGNDYFKAQAQGMSYPAIIPDTTSVGAVYDANVGPMAYQSGAEATSTDKDRLTPFSQRLHETLAASSRTDVFAPGAVVTSSGINSIRGESEQQGTSQAAPMTAGVILLVQEYYKRAKGTLPPVDDVERWLRDGAVLVNDDCNACDNVPHTKKKFPRLDAVGALTAVKKAIQN